MRCVSAISSVALLLLYCHTAVATIKSVANPALPEPPLVLSYAAQPVSHFNKSLAIAQQQQASWSHDPQQISQQYSGTGFELVTAKEYQGKVITYSVRPSQSGHPQMLLILALGKKKGHWALEKARLSWRCSEDNFFSTNHCNITAHTADNKLQ
ncbi:hypothetical protein PY479_05650 [Shewanella sp. A32]|uniref:hypothetical protein n=1 Tax=Shewanella sp. A32 TaxID=3031327 RepID=UPI0023B93FF3|nr:hypothetical protein [Shewanella sp. A32]MDF0533766.1 hypothetical protein [Shewanella sp. A32]